MFNRGVRDVKHLNLRGEGGASSRENLYTPRRRNVPLSNRSDLTAGSPHVCGYFLKQRIFFSLFFEKYASKCSLLDSFLSVHMKARKRWTYDSTPFRAFAVRCMTSSHSKTFVYVRPHENDKPAFTKTPLWRPFENPRSWYPKTPFTYGRKVERRKKISVFKNIRRRENPTSSPGLFLKKWVGRRPTHF